MKSLDIRVSDLVVGNSGVVDARSNSSCPVIWDYARRP